ncbi:MAG: BamA/TamA family outer membrane protein, partial [Ignavibacteria bacterium]
MKNNFTKLYQLRNFIKENSAVKVPFYTLLTVISLIFSQNSSTATSLESKYNVLARRYEIDDIDFVFKGTETFNENTLLDIMSTPKSSTYKQVDLALDIKRIKKFYFDNGFFNSIVDTALDYYDEDEEVDIKIIIVEKERYKIYKIEYKGLDSIAQHLRQGVYEGRLIKPEENYNKAQILNETNRILDILQNNGYLNAMVDTLEGTVISKYASYDPKLKNKITVSLTFIGADKIYYFGNTRIDIRNNIYRIEDDLILRELDYKKGELYNKEKIIGSERNFTKLAIIQSGRIEVDTVIEDRNILNLRVKVLLNFKYELTPNIKAVDIQGQFHLGAGLQYIDKNFFHGGRVFSTELNGLIHSKVVNRIELNATLFQPYFFSNRITATFNLKFGILNDEVNQIYTLSNLARLNYYIAPYTFYQNVFSDLTVDLIRTKHKKDVVTGDDTVKSGTISNQMNSIIGFTFVHDNTNNIFHPWAGFYHSLTVENAGVLPRILSLINQNIDYSQYVKFYIPNKFYFNLAAERPISIFAAKIIIGDIIEYGREENIVPVLRIYKFYSGGSSSLRGWNAKENGILEDPLNGGKFLFEGSVEHRWKLFSLSESFLQNFWLVNFLDYGNVWESGRLFKIKEIALAIGFG